MRPIRLGMVGGGSGAFIGAIHRIAARMDGHFTLVAGALIGHAAVAGWRLNRPLGQLWRGVALIVVLNVALTVLIPSIAWEAHLGGAVTGLMMGAFTGHRATRRR
jgi:membrane associated rhomboid family serine protease